MKFLIPVVLACILGSTDTALATNFCNGFSSSSVIVNVRQRAGLFSRLRARHRSSVQIRIPSVVQQQVVSSVAVPVVSQAVVPQFVPQYSMPVSLGASYHGINFGGLGAGSYSAGGLSAVDYVTEEIKKLVLLSAALKELKSGP